MSRSLNSLLATLALAAGLCAAAGPAAATEVYRWKDANGVTHYGARPPEGVEAERMNIKEPPPATPVAAPSPPASSEEGGEGGAGGEGGEGGSVEEANARAEAARQEALAAAAQARRIAREANCARARQNLQVLRNNNLVTLREGGESRTLSAEQIAAQIAENEAAEAQNCGPESSE